MQKIRLQNIKELSGGLRNTFLGILLLFPVSSYITYLVLKNFPAFTNTQYEGVRNAMLNNTGLNDFLSIFISNVVASFAIMILGFLAEFLPAVAIIFNGWAMGVVFAEFELKGRSILALLISILPHAVFEIPVLVYAACLGTCFMKINRKEQGLNIKEKNRRYLEIVIAYSVIVPPLLLIASAIEVYISPGVLKMLGW